MMNINTTQLPAGMRVMPDDFEPVKDWEGRVSYERALATTDLVGRVCHLKMRRALPIGWNRVESSHAVYGELVKTVVWVRGAETHEWGDVYNEGRYFVASMPASDGHLYVRSEPTFSAYAPKSLFTPWIDCGTP